jgi:catechol 2,3-dioxygenase-like lactoylglutathione lyase family enzyme
MARRQRGRLLAVDHIQLSIPEGDEHLDTARECYVGVLGLTEIEKPAALRNRGGLWFEGGDGDSRFEIHLDVGLPPHSKRHPAFVTDDLARLLTRVEEAGIEIVEDVPLEDRGRFSAHDPFGNRLEFLEYRRRD